MENNRKTESKAPSFEEFFSEDAIARRKARCIVDIRNNLYTLLSMQGWSTHQAHLFVQLVDMLIKERPKSEILDFVRANFYERFNWYD